MELQRSTSKDILSKYLSSQSSIRMAKFDACETELLKPSVLKEGHLLKIGRKLKLPKLHYYVLKPCGVYCFGTRNNDIPHTYIPLEPIEDLSLSLGTVIESRTRLHCIKIADKRKQHVLACHSVEIRDSWITAILTAIAQNIVYESESELRRSLDSSLNSDETDGVFYDAYFTSPFWVAGDRPKVKSRAKRLSMADLGIISKPSWMNRGSKKKKERSKSLSFDDLHSINSAAEVKTQFFRKRSLHDLTRYLFTSSTNRNEIGADGHQKTKYVKKRWSLFSGVSSLSVSLGGGIDESERKKLRTGSSSPKELSVDTKL